MISHWNYCMENITACLNRRINAVLGAGILENVIIDTITVSEQLNTQLDKSNLVLEAKVLFSPIHGVKNYTYRIDKQLGDGGPGRQRHIHLYKNGEEQFAMNVDATSHDGYHQVRIPDDIVPFLQSKGFQIPANNIIELKQFDNRGQLLVENVNTEALNQIVLSVASVFRSAQRVAIIESNVDAFQVIWQIKRKYGYQHVNKLADIPQGRVSEIYYMLVDFLKSTGKYSDDVTEFFDGSYCPHKLYVAWNE